MIKRISVLVLVTLVLFGCGQKESDQATESPGSSEEVTTTEAAAGDEVIPAPGEVFIQNNRFEPASVTIATGMTVKWTNLEDTKHWIASDPHPSHTGLPGFDSKKGLAKDESFKFTFTKKGTFSYHDHLNLSLTGQVVVTD